ncbi:MAG: DUF3311 domain-containing protein [Chloroflexi bacterium]|nr:DUF3311 domain-containing protein [Chloroflexota bacterium]
MRPRNWLLVVLLIPFAAVLWPPLYAHPKPTILGMPMFIWYQFAWAIITAVLTIVVYALQERGEAASTERDDAR